MKKVVVALFWVLFGAGCKKEIIEKTVLPCDCKGVPIIGYSEPFSALILFPKIPTEPYSLHLIPTGAVESNPNITICSDSTFTRLVKELKLADSSKVYLSKWGTFNRLEITCMNEYNKSVVPVRILEMKKLP